MNEHRNHYGLATMCRVLGVARSGFYQWLHQPLSHRALEDHRLLSLVRASYAASGGVYGSPSGELNDKGQSIYYGKVGGCVITGNEDGIKHTAMTIGYALNHLGYTMPPQADCGWIGEAGPGPSYGDTKEDGGRVGFDNDFTQRNTTIMTWNCMHIAGMLKESGGIPNEGNNREAWSAGERFGFENPDGKTG